MRWIANSTIALLHGCDVQEAKAGRMVIGLAERTREFTPLTRLSTTVNADRYFDESALLIAWLHASPQSSGVAVYDAAILMIHPVDGSAGQSNG
jgi:hypothetical protein